jgi:hypothetical protein
MELQIFIMLGIAAAGLGFLIFFKLSEKKSR